ncbi:hypothetical protein [Yimella sp. NH-Cas1]|nr:hypothetical protein [Yimella sp. NH-Cas1]
MFSHVITACFTLPDARRRYFDAWPVTSEHSSRLVTQSYSDAG